MIQISPAGAWLDRLARLERFYDGPIPAPLRRQVFAEPSAPDRFEAGRWAVLFRESRNRTERLRSRAAALTEWPARRALAEALRLERAWARHCRDQTLVE